MYPILAYVRIIFVEEPIFTQQEFATAVTTFLHIKY